MATAKKAAPVTCSWKKGGKFTLCNGMDRYAKSHSDRRGPGIYLLDNWCDMKTMQFVNLGPAYVGNIKVEGKKDGGLLFSWCPWCGSDLEKNWFQPAMKDWGKRKAAKLKSRSKKASPKDPPKKRKAA